MVGRDWSDKPSHEVQAWVGGRAGVEAACLGGISKPAVKVFMQEDEYVGGVVAAAAVKPATLLGFSSTQL